MKNTLIDYLNEFSSTKPGSAALINASGWMDYGTLNKRADLWAAYFKNKNLSSSSTILMAGRNDFRTVCCYLGAFKAGVPVSWVNPMLDADQLKYIIQDLSPELAIVEADFLQRVQAAVPELKWQAIHELDESLAQQEDVGQVMVLEAKQLASILYTSGSMGKPVGVMLSHENLVRNAESIASYMQIESSSRMFVLLPFFYSYGLSLLTSHLIEGASLYLEDKFAYPEAALEDLEKSGCSGFAGVTSHYQTLLEKTTFKKRKLKALEFFAHAGDKMPEFTVKELQRSYPEKRIYLMYGQTEASPRLTYLKPHKVLSKPNSVGQPIQDVQIQIQNPDGQECKPFTAGQICAKGPGIMLGYWNNPGLTAEKLKDGWLHTGDIGYLDNDGDLFIQGRMDALIKINGRRLSLLELEEKASNCEGISTAAAIAAPPHSSSGAVVIIYCSLSQTYSKANVIFELKKQFNLYGNAVKIEVLDSIPLTPSGKIDRNYLISQSKYLFY